MISKLLRVIFVVAYQFVAYHIFLTYVMFAWSSNSKDFIQSVSDSLPLFGLIPTSITAIVGFMFGYKRAMWGLLFMVLGGWFLALLYFHGAESGSLLAAYYVGPLMLSFLVAIGLAESSARAALRYCVPIGSTKSEENL